MVGDRHGEPVTSLPASCFFNAWCAKFVYFFAVWVSFIHDFSPDVFLTHLAPTTPHPFLIPIERAEGVYLFSPMASATWTHFRDWREQTSVTVIPR